MANVVAVVVRRPTMPIPCTRSVSPARLTSLLPPSMSCAPQALIVLAVVGALAYQWYTDPERIARRARAARLAELERLEAERRRKPGKPVSSSQPAAAAREPVPAAPARAPQPSSGLPKGGKGPRAASHVPKPPSKPAHPAQRAVLKGHTDAVTAVAVSLDGKYLTSTSTGASGVAWRRSPRATLPLMGGAFANVVGAHRSVPTRLEPLNAGRAEHPVRTGGHPQWPRDPPC